MSKLFVAAFLAMLMVAPAFAQDDAAKKKRAQRGQQGQRNAAVQIIKQLEEVKLTDDQVAKIKELGKSVAAKTKAIRDEAGITPELVKKRAEAQKALKDSGKKGKELMEAINREAGYSEAQAEAVKKMAEVRTAFQKQVIGLLTDEQKENLPTALKRAAGAGEKADAKPRKKKQN